jgi:hypothetical protein
MGKVNELANAFTQQLKQDKKPFKESFEVTKPNSTNAFSGMFGEPKLTEKEQREIELILSEYFQPGVKQKDPVTEDLKSLLALTAEIKAISSQSILLHGERIQKAQILLRDYKEGAFTKWLFATYGNRQTPYSMLRYYEMYQQAPVSHKSLIESAPKKAIYLLASRNGDLNKKLELLKNHGKEPQADLVLLIQEIFPLDKKDNRKAAHVTALSIMQKECSKLEKRKQPLSETDISNIETLIQRLQQLLPNSKRSQINRAEYGLIS